MKHATNTVNQWSDIMATIWWLNDATVCWAPFCFNIIMIMYFFSIYIYSIFLLHHSIFRSDYKIRYILFIQFFFLDSSRNGWVKKIKLKMKSDFFFYTELKERDMKRGICTLNPLCMKNHNMFFFVFLLFKMSFVVVCGVGSLYIRRHLTHVQCKMGYCLNFYW